MFLFIWQMIGFEEICVESLNTSHVLIYPKFRTAPLAELEFKYISCSYFICGARTDSSGKTFKYISCSYLSAYWIKLISQDLFKYISCSYLSTVDAEIKSGGIWFKYISCSYLSICIRAKNPLVESLNTSHVLIYRLIRCIHGIHGIVV